MIFNSISNQYNKIGGDPQHLRRMKMIESQRISYLPSGKPIPAQSRIYMERRTNNIIDQYPSTNTALGQINKQLTHQSSLRQSIKRSKIFDNRSVSSKQGSDLRNSRHSGMSLDRNNNDQTKYTFNPITQKKSHMNYKPLSGSSKIQPNYTYKVLSPAKWKSGNQRVQFNYVGSSDIQRNQIIDPIKGQMFDRNHHYFPTRTINSDFNSLTRRPIISSDASTNRSTKQHSSNQQSAVKFYNQTYPQPDKHMDQEADRFFDMDFKAGILEGNPFQSKEFSPKNIKIESSLTNKPSQTVIKKQNGLQKKLTDKFKNLDKQGKTITLAVIGLAIFLVILQTIQ